MVISKLDQILQRDDIPSEVKREIQHLNNLYQELEESKKQLGLREEAIKYLKQKLTLNDRIVDIFIRSTDDSFYLEVLQVVLDVLENKFGIFEIEKTSMNLCEFLQDTLEPYNLLLEDQFEFQGCLEGSSISIFGDSIRLQQVFDNVIDNAIKHTD